MVCHVCLAITVQVDMPRFKVGDLVKVSSDMEKMQNLQQGHGDWSNAVLLVLCMKSVVTYIHAYMYQ